MIPKNSIKILGNNHAYIQATQIGSTYSWEGIGELGMGLRGPNRKTEDEQSTLCACMKSSKNWYKYCILKTASVEMCPYNPSAILWNMYTPGLISQPAESTWWVPGQ